MNTRFSLRKLFQFPWIVIILLALLLIAVGGYWWLGNHVFDTHSHGDGYTVEDGYHIHADFMVFINEEPINFSKEAYMDVGEVLHLHDGNGRVMHHHAENKSLGAFFGTLNMTYNATCFSYDGTAYCENASHDLTLLVNGTGVADGHEYVPQDMDRLLISYHETSANLSEEMNQVSDMACIYSHECPERGTPPPEECAGNSCVISFE